MNWIILKNKKILKIHLWFILNSIFLYVLFFFDDFAFIGFFIFIGMFLSRYLIDDNYSIRKEFTKEIPHIDLFYGFIVIVVLISILKITPKITPIMEILNSINDYITRDLIFLVFFGVFFLLYIQKVRDKLKAEKTDTSKSEIN